VCKCISTLYSGKAREHLPSLSSYQGLKHFSQSPVLAWQDLQSAKHIDLFCGVLESVVMRGEVSKINYLDRMLAVWVTVNRHAAIMKKTAGVELR
jgi:hypothetical protein